MTNPLMMRDVNLPYDNLEFWVRKLTTLQDRPTTQEEFIQRHLEEKMDQTLADLEGHEWPTYDSLAAHTPIGSAIPPQSTGMSAFNDPDDTPIPEIDNEGDIGLHDAEDDNDSVTSEEVTKTPYDYSGTYDPTHDNLPTSAKVSPAQNETAYYIRKGNSEITDIVRLVGRACETTDSKVNQIGTDVQTMMKLIQHLTEVVTTQGTMIFALDRKLSGLQNPRQNNSTNNNNDAGTNSNKGNNNARQPPVVNNSTRPKAPQLDKGKGTYASAAAKGAETPFQTVTKQKKNKPAPLFNTTIPPVQREIVITSIEPIPSGTMDDRILQSINQSLGGQFRFMFAKATGRNTIILQTPTDSDSTAALRFDSEIRNGLLKIQINVTEIKANSKMSRFIIDGIPTAIGPSPAAGCIEMAKQITANYPEIELAQVPVWMCKPDNLTTKIHASMIIAFKGTHTIDSLGRRSLAICNKFCRLRPYLIQTPTTQCHKCQRYGHHTDLCKEEIPTCGHCTLPHLTKDHPYTTCPGGYKCTHTPLRCINCPGEPHTAYDPNCKAKARIIAARRDARPLPQNEPMNVAL